ncbi:hypothetical protein ACFLXU_04025 [Chloroflexota bacterium]
MTVGVILALVFTIPLMLIPVALVWYINIGGIYTAIREARVRKAALEKEAAAVEAR